MLHQSSSEMSINREINTDRTGHGDELNDRRITQRFTKGMPLDVTKDRNDREALFSATMHDLSEGGIGFWAHADLSPGDVLFVREFDAETRGVWVRTRVRHLTPGLQGKLVGVAFESEPDDLASTAVEPAPSRAPAPAPPPPPPPTPTMPTAGLRTPGPGRQPH